MVYTTHGHQIPDTTVLKPRPGNPKRCGAVHGCPQCHEEAKNVHEYMVGTGTDFLVKARDIVQAYIDRKFAVSFTMNPPEYKIVTIQFSRIKQDWTALFNTTLSNVLLYEVTYNSNKRETSLAVHNKIDEIVIPD